MEIFNQYKRDKCYWYLIIIRNVKRRGYPRNIERLIIFRNFSARLASLRNVGLKFVALPTKRARLDFCMSFGRHGFICETGLSRKLRYAWRIVGTHGGPKLPSSAWRRIMLLAFRYHVVNIEQLKICRWINRLVDELTNYSKSSIYRTAHLQQIRALWIFRIRYRNGRFWRTPTPL